MIWKRCQSALAAWPTVRGVFLGIGLVLLVSFLPRLFSGYSNNFFQATLGQPAGIELTELITRVKEQLYLAERKGVVDGQTPLLTLADVELEVVFVVQVENKADVKSDFKLVAVSGATATELGQTQRVKLRLKPIEASPGAVEPQQAPVIEEGGARVTGPSPPPARAPAKRTER